MPQGSCILITGGADGLGRALALRHAAQGDHVEILDVDSGKGCEFAAENSGISFQHIDLADLGSPPVAPVPAAFDTVILNAGISAFGLFPEIPWDRQWDVMRVNVEGHLRLLHHLFEADRIRAGGQIGFVLSAAAYTPVPVAPVYSATKATLDAFARSIEPWLLDRDIRITRIYPGQMRTAHLTKYYGNANPKAGVAPEIIAERVFRGMRRRQRSIHPDGMSRALRLLTVGGGGPWLPYLLARFNRRQFGSPPGKGGERA